MSRMLALGGRAAARRVPVSFPGLLGSLACALLAACGGGDDSPAPTLQRPAAALKKPLAAAAAAPTEFAPTVYDPATPDQVRIGTIVVGDTRYNDVVITWGSLLAAGIDPPTSSYNAYDPATGRVSLPQVRLGSTTYTNVVVTLAGLVSIGGSAALAPIIPNDPLFADQWHLNNTGQAGPDGKPGLAGEDLRATMAWNYVTGTGVRIAVVDDGLDIHHEDFDVVAGKSWDYRTNAYGDPSSGESSHGTACAGLAAAKGQNGIGVTGVAFHARMVGYNLLQASMDQYGADAVVKDLADNQIYTNSYGAPDGTGTFSPATQAWRDAIDNGTTQGRGGKGAIYTWAAGNGAPVDRSDHDGQGNYQGVMAIGSLNDQGKRSSYSEPGANILVMGFGGEQCEQHTTTTADVSGDGGYNNGTSAKKAGDPYNDYSGKPNYTRCMNGTSAATPEVAGVAALMLEMNPNLGWRDVRAILAKTARKNDPTDADWVTNAAGLKVNHQYGFGAADAAAAVLAARGWTNLPAQKTATADHAAPGAVGTEASPLVSTVSLAGSGIDKLEFVDVVVDADTADAGGLSITLTSPGGTVSTLSTPHQCMDLSDADNPKPVTCGQALSGGFRFGVVRLMDEPADGTWKLSIGDKTGQASTLTRWSIKAYGH
ncbi:S8 family serine peptidase [Aquabacterium sp.]|uniref:S8 family serine peptidase n=1 Tax=Aquabacterium sp. TaxID=1872578 RepID=UPI003784233D